MSDNDQIDLDKLHKTLADAVVGIAIDLNNALPENTVDMSLTKGGAVKSRANREIAAAEAKAEKLFDTLKELPVSVRLAVAERFLIERRNQSITSDLVDAYFINELAEDHKHLKGARDSEDLMMAHIENQQAFEAVSPETLKKVHQKVLSVS